MYQNEISNLKHKKKINRAKALRISIASFYTSKIKNIFYRIIHNLYYNNRTYLEL